MRIRFFLFYYICHPELVSGFKEEMLKIYLA
jgi:hypothetical protein